MTEKYPEILELYSFCEKNKITATLEKLYDGYAIRFPDGGDFVQHYGSYGNDRGCVEPAIGCKRDYTAVPLRDAKMLVTWHRFKCNLKSKETKDNLLVIAGALALLMLMVGFIG